MRPGVALALALAAGVLLSSSNAQALPEEGPKARAAPPRPPPARPAPAHGRVYRGGSVPGGARRAIERELRAQDECPACEGGGWECYAPPCGRGPCFRECPACFNPRGYPSP